MKRTLMFAAACIGLIALAGAALSFAFPGADNARAIGISAAIALAVQIGAFAILRVMRGPTVMIGWGIGSGVRFLALIIYGFAASTVLGLPLTAALVSLATFLFATSVLEPLLLEK
jgi:hypothetical protein